MSREKLPRNVIALGVVSLLTDVSSDMIVPLLPLFITATLGAGPAALGVIEGVAEATASFLKLASGAWSDRASRKKPLVVWGYSLAAVARPLTAFAGSWVHVLFIRFADRTGKGIRTSPRDALIAASVREEVRGKAFGWHRAMDNLGAVLGPAAAFLLLSVGGFSYRTIFLLAAVPGIAAVIALVLFVKETASGKQDPGKGFRLGDGALPPPFRRYLFALGVFTLGNASDSFLILRAVDAGVPAGYIPLLWGAFHVVKSSLSTYGGILSDRVGRRKMILAGWAVYAATYAAWGLTQGVYWMVGLFLVYGIHHAACEGAERALVADLVPPERRGTAYGWFHLVVGICALPASVLFGFLWKEFGAPAAFGVSAGLALLAAVLLLLSLPGRAGNAENGTQGQRAG
ncbi:MAG: major facilitator superfamily 1 [Deltaproteobacteria bacterium]|nr:major facilitator superfamily 1 [Deltaproteobacteria bacterium]